MMLLASNINFLTIREVHVQHSPEQIKRKSDLVLQHLPIEAKQNLMGQIKGT